MYIQAYFNIALQLTAAYKNEVPLTAYLKKYFSENKKHGSRDRKYISHFCYCFYRTGHLFNKLNAEEKLSASIFLCSAFNEQLSILFKDEWKEVFALPLPEKLLFIEKLFDVQSANIFPFNKHLSAAINKNDFILSHLQQPDVFLRIRPGYHEAVITKLEKENISFIEPLPNCIQLGANFKADKFFSVDKEVVIQDMSSQSVQKLLENTVFHHAKVWDVCAGSGGKSLLVNDMLNNVHITATDIRTSIIYNLQQRFKKAGIKNYSAFVEDVSGPSFTCKNKYNLIICDVPCTGSGTWGRTPEQLYFFKKEQIEKYQWLQKKIVTNALKCMQPAAYLLYITCSVFAEENENLVEWMLQHLSVTLVKQTILKGYHKKADTMFAALFSLQS